MSTQLPPPVPPPPQRQPDPILDSWDRGARGIFSWLGGLFYLAVIILLGVMTIGAVAYIGAGDSTMAWPFIFWVVVLALFVQRLARIKRRR